MTLHRSHRLVRNRAVWLALVAMSAAALADSGEGLRATPSASPSLPQWQARLGLTTPAPLLDRPLERGWAAQVDYTAPPVLSASLMGDYYPGWVDGLRATGGLLVGPRTTPWTSTPRLGASLAMERHRVPLGATATGRDGAEAGAGTVPYLGVGYSAASQRRGWGFAADVGLMALSPGTVGGAFSGQRSTEEVLRDLRLTPTLQLGVSYSF